MGYQQFRGMQGCTPPYAHIFCGICMGKHIHIRHCQQWLQFFESPRQRVISYTSAIFAAGGSACHNLKMKRLRPYPILVWKGPCLPLRTSAVFFRSTRHFYLDVSIHGQPACLTSSHGYLSGSFNLESRLSVSQMPIGCYSQSGVLLYFKFRWRSYFYPAYLHIYFG